MKKQLIAIIGFIGLAIGCASHLQLGGAYAPAQTTVVNGVTNVVALSASEEAFYKVELTFDLADAATLAVFDSERKNRAFLWSVSPKIKHALDDLRPQVSQARRAYFTARKVYKLNPTPANLGEVQTYLTQFSTLAESVKAAVQTK